MSDGHPLVGRSLAGVAAAVPANAQGVQELSAQFGPGEAAKISASTGIETRRVSPPGTCASDYCHAAAVKLLEALQWDPASIDVLIFVSQTPDYILPATSCLLQRRLGLPKTCAAFDINLGCSGYVYGLWVASNLVNAQRKRALLLVGDSITKLLAPGDRSVIPIFGDAGTASAIEWTGRDEPWWFELGTDGSGENHLVVPGGGFRNRDDREHTDLQMNGAEVFAFTIREIAPLINRITRAASWSVEDVDAYVLHQANRMMLEHIAKKCRIPLDRLPLSLDQFGNTSSASIPLALVHSLGERLQAETCRLVLSGFGVGFSWGAVAMTAGPAVIVPVVYL
jgi:3-oxoacyl-[acyl-carrier-protein] synthase-3